MEAALSRDQRRGIFEERKHTVTVGSAATIVAEAHPLILRARDQLLRKTDSITARNVFLIVHPFERLAVELMDDGPVLASHLKPLVNIDGLDTVWIYWAPDQVTLWSTSAGEWMNLIFNAYGVNEHPLHDGSSFALLQDAELDFLGRTGQTLQSPFVFEF